MSLTSILVVAQVFLGCITRANAAGFCHNRRRGGLPTNSYIADKDFCQFTCPCCDSTEKQLAKVRAAQTALTLTYMPDGKPLKMQLHKNTTRRGRALQEKKVSSMRKRRTVKGASMKQRWATDGSNVFTKIMNFKRTSKMDQASTAIDLYDVSDDDFHKTLMTSVTAGSLSDFIAAKYDDFADDLSDLQSDKGWDDSELAIYMYTTEDPDVYRPMNAMLRKATSMDDIDSDWQSYIGILRDGLQNHAKFNTAETYRGVPCDASDALVTGDEGVLPSFTSTSTDEDVAHQFGCDVLHFTGGGFDISMYSDFPGEAEVLMEEGRVYTVANNPGEGDGEEIDLTTDGNSLTLADSDAQTEDVDDSTQDCSSVDQGKCPICQCCTTEKPDADGSLSSTAATGDLLSTAMLTAIGALLGVVGTIAFMSFRRRGSKDLSEALLPPGSEATARLGGHE